MGSHSLNQGFASSSSQQFKLSGFLNLVVSVGTRTAPSTSGSSGSCHLEEDHSQPFERHARACSRINSHCPDSCCFSDESEQSEAIVAGKVRCEYVYFRKGKSKDKLASACRHDAEESFISIANVLIGAECWLAEEANEVVLHTDKGFILRAISHSRLPQDFVDDEHTCNVDFPYASIGSIDSDLTTEAEVCSGTMEKAEWSNFVTTKIVSSGNSHLKPDSLKLIRHSNGVNGVNGVMEVKGNIELKSRKKTGYAKGTGDILHQLQVLATRNSLELKGHVILAASRAADVRAVVLLDLYLSSSLWSDRNYWKAGPVAAAVFQHISCDWVMRKEYLAAASCQNQRVENVDLKELWNLGECEIFSCKMHFHCSEEVKRSRFNLHTLFKSVPSINKQEQGFKSVILPSHEIEPCPRGIWDIPDGILTSVFSRLLPKDLQSVAAVCRHMRELAALIMPCMNLRLFPHQRAAVHWMLQRELNPHPAVHPLYRDLQTEDGFHFYLNCVSGDLSPELPPTVPDFRGGLFCDEPGLGKTVTALSVILKTQGTLSTPPVGIQVRWCYHRSGDIYGYYEISLSPGTNIINRSIDLKARHNRLSISPQGSQSPHDLSTFSGGHKRLRHSFSGSSSLIRSNRHWSSVSASGNSVKRKLLETYNELPIGSLCSTKKRRSAVGFTGAQNVVSGKSKMGSAAISDIYEDSDMWVQCDSCRKWRKVPDGDKPPEEGLAWFCNMSKDPLYQSCSDPEENWDDSGAIKSLPGFYKAGSSPGQEQNIEHFANVLTECSSLRDSETKAALTWLANLPTEKLEQMAGPGVALPTGLGPITSFGDDFHGYQKIFQRFGLVQTGEGKGLKKKWCYPQCLLDNLVFDLPALREALTRPLDAMRMYLSRATLIVVPPNLVEHWKNQIFRHTKPGQLRVCIWNEHKKPPQAQELAWNYDVVITTFPCLSAEWPLRESSVLMSVHWLRIILDEGHTLGSNLSLTNKLQMAVSMKASRRWILTGTPTPNTPNSHVGHLQPMLRFFHEEVYGKDKKSWEVGILKPFETGREEGRIRLLQLLQRCMISARKSDLCTIPPCVRKITLLDFTEKHAESYNELVVTVRRNILMADWNDPSHVESLLNPKQWKFRSNTIRNVRLSCCVAGHIKMRNAGEDIRETMDIFVQQGMDPLSLEFTVIRAALLYGSNCERCKEWCRLPIVTPCKHLLCMDCIELDRERCTLPGCGHPYKMQSPEDLARPENPSPKWPVPQDLIELQPSYVQENWNADWEATCSSKVAYLVERLKTLKGRTVEEDPFEPFLRPLSPSCMGSDRFWKLQQISLPEKAIVFSQFLEHINVIERQLTEADIKVAPLYSPMHSSNKMKSLLRFENDPDCTVLLMDGSAALGLDLSFVTHVFLMEPIWDRSVEEQVVSRAHRMGATRPVMVETLAMRGTIEEQMTKFLQDPVEHSHLCGQMVESGRSSYRTVHEFAESSYLAQLSFVRTKTLN